MFLEGKATQIAIGQIRGYLKPSKAERAAAFELFVELSVRVTTPSIDDERGTLRDTFDNLAAIGDVTREILRKHGCDAAKGREDGNITLAVVALRVLNEIIAPRVISWEPALRDHESLLAVQPSPTAPYAWEQQWARRELAMDDLAEMRREIRSYMDTLSLIAGTPSLTDLVVPLPPSAPINPSPVELPIPRSESDAPRNKMVRWFSPFEAFGTMRANRGHHPNAAGGRPPIHQIQTGEPIVIEPGADGCTWIDYVSDLGDGFDPTAAVAFQLTRASITLPIDRSGELPDPPGYLPRGSLLVMGGDQVYPHASEEGYRQQLILPYTMAASAVTAGGAPPDPAHNTLVAIPGNHDWYGGHEHFDQLFAAGETFAGHWSTPQRERWWSVQLPHGWWIWGIDTALDNTVDDIQKAFFREAADRLENGDQVVLCTPVPLWQLRQKRAEEYNELRSMINTLILEKGGRTPLFLSGDSHFFAHYRRVDGVADEHHITAGGGGAFMQPTHNLPEQVPYERGTPEFKLDSRWPRPVESRALGTDLGNIKDPQFRSLFAIIALVHAAFAGLISIRAGALQHVELPATSADVAARWVIAAWPGWPILALLLISMMMATAPNSQESQLVNGAKRYGLLHGVAQAALFVAVAAFGRYVGPNAWWWRFALVPLIGGVLSTILFVLAVRWINRSIKANDTLAFSSAHLTRYKQFVRMYIDPEGDLHVYVVGIDPVGVGWYDALTTNGVERARVPPFDPAGVSKLHYVWGHSFANGSERTVEARRRSLGRDHPDTLFAMASLGRRLFSSNPSAAVTHLHAAVDGALQTHGASHVTTLGYSDRLAEAQFWAGDTADAFDRLRASIDTRRSTGQTLATAETYRLLANLYSIARDFEGASDAYQRAIDEYRRDQDQRFLLPDVHEITIARLLCDGAAALLRTDRFEMAEVMLAECTPVLAQLPDDDPSAQLVRDHTAHLLVRTVRHQSPEDTAEGEAARRSAAIAQIDLIVDDVRARHHEPTPLSIDAALALAWFHSAGGRFVEAAHVLDDTSRSLRLIRETPDVLEWRVVVGSELVVALREAESWPEAVAAHRQLLADREASEGADTAAALYDQQMMAFAQKFAGDGWAAIATLTDVRDRLAAGPHDDVQFVQGVRVILARWLIELGRPEQALDEIATVDLSQLVDRHRSAHLRAQIVHAQALAALFRLPAAAEVLTAAEVFFRGTAQHSDEHDHDCYELAGAFASVFDSEAVVRLLEPRLGRFVEEYGPLHHRTIESTALLAFHFTRVGRAHDAITMLVPCREALLPLGKDEFIDSIDLLLQQAAESAGQHEMALEVANRQIVRAVERHGEDSVEALRALRVAAGLTISSDPAAAAASLEQILRTSERTMGRAHGNLQRLRFELSAALERSGDVDAALAVSEEALEIAEERLPDHPQFVGQMRSRVARLSAVVGDHRRSIALNERLLTYEGLTDGERNFSRVAVMNDLTRSYLASGRLDDAMRSAVAARDEAATSSPRSDSFRVEAEQLVEELLAPPGLVAPDA